MRSLMRGKARASKAAGLGALLLVLCVASCAEPKQLRVVENAPVFASVAEARRDVMFPKRRIPEHTVLTITRCIHEKDYVFLEVELPDGSLGIVYPGPEIEYIPDDQLPC